jgi:hypothetical protein
MISLIATVLGIIGPLLKWGISSLLANDEISEEDKRWLIQADQILSQRSFFDIKRARDLEKKLPDLDKEMDDIESGVTPPPWKRPQQNEKI